MASPAARTGAEEEEQVPTPHYYATYYGHAAKHLSIVHATLRRAQPGSGISRRTAIFLAGDSSLDNKYWFNRREDAVNGYERVLQPPVQKADVCYWLNVEAVRRQRRDLFALNTAVEATTLSSRALGRLLPQDRFIREHITEDDYLVVSVGGNDIALAPLLLTAVNMVLLMCCTPEAAIEKAACACPPDTYATDCGCLCCGAQGCAAGVCGCPPGLGYMVDLFGNRVKQYVQRLIGRRKPKAVVVCMIYYPDMLRTGGWADGTLKFLGYDRRPQKLQLAIRTVFELATRRIKLRGTRVIPFPLFAVLDGMDSHDYVQRVEPSPQGGEKMARALMDAIVDGTPPSQSASIRRPEAGTLRRD